jgi:hypothetical protein
VHAALVAARSAFIKTGTGSSPHPVEPPAALEEDDMLLDDMMLQEAFPTPTLGVALLLGLGIGFMTDSSH